MKLIASKLKKTALLIPLLALLYQPLEAGVYYDQYFIQFGAYKNDANAHFILQDFIQQHGGVGRVHPNVVNGQLFYEVQTGPFQSYEQAQDALNMLHVKGYVRLSPMME